MELVAIDPGTKETGIAVFQRGYLVHAVLCRDKHKDWKIRCQQIRLQVSIFCCQQIDCAIIELPSYEFSVRGRAAARTDSTIKLAYLCGLIGATLEAEDGIHLVTPRQWKGGLPKTVTAQRVKDKYSLIKDETNHNVLDAVAIGDWYLRKHAS